MANRYKVTAWHGEARTAYYVVDTFAPSDEQPAVVHAFHSQYLAEDFCIRHNISPEE